MKRIDKKVNFFKRNLNYIFAFFWLSMGFAFYLNSDLGRYLVSTLYGISGILYAWLAYKQKDRNTEYIAWDEEKLIVARLHQKPKAYYFSPEVNIHLSNYNLIIKAPRATGDMVELKGFTEEDLDLLREKFANPAVA
jgi:hypothetical protein